MTTGQRLLLFCVLHHVINHLIRLLFKMKDVENKIRSFLNWSCPNMELIYDETFGLELMLLIWFCCVKWNFSRAQDIFISILDTYTWPSRWLFQSFQGCTRDTGIWPSRWPFEGSTCTTYTVIDRTIRQGDHLKVAPGIWPSRYYFMVCIIRTKEK